MSEPKKKPAPQTYTLELPALGELRLVRENPVIHPKTVQSLEDTVNEDLIRRLINRLKKM
jgi:hypothetical protein